MDRDNVEINKDLTAPIDLDMVVAEYEALEKVNFCSVEFRKHTHVSHHSITTDPLGRYRDSGVGRMKLHWIAPKR